MASYLPWAASPKWSLPIVSVLAALAQSESAYLPPTGLWRCPYILEDQFGIRHHNTGCNGEGNGNPFQYPCLEISWTQEPGGLQSMESQRVGHD